MRFAAVLAIGVIVLSANAQVQERKKVAAEVTKEAWNFSLGATTSVMPDFQNYTQPPTTFIADRGRLHLEVRYNYEDLNTGSVWLGYHFGGGEKLKWSFKPMLGGAFGDTTGVVSGYRLSLAYRKLTFSTEDEFVFDARDPKESFLYSWSELSIWPADWFRFGLVGHCRRAYKNHVDFEPGLLVGLSYKQVAFTTYVFNLDQGKPTWAFCVGVSF